MKKFLALFVTLLLAITMAGCKKPPLVISESDTYVIINVQNAEENQSLASYMASLEDYKDMFTIEDGMVISINGISNALDWSACWMLYTNDEALSDTGWGTAQYNGEIFGSALYGAERLIVKNGKSYIWIYQTF